MIENNTTMSAGSEEAIDHTPKPAGEFYSQEKLQKAKDSAWIDPTPYDYNDTAQTTTNGAGEIDEFKLPWGTKAGRYEWNEDYGDVGPAIPELEAQLFCAQMISHKGISFDKLASIKVTAEATERPAPILSFAAAGLHPVMLENVKKCLYDYPTPIQAYAIPAIMQGRDVIATAQTGSGKTQAYLIPSIGKLMGKARKLAAPRPGLTKGFNPNQRVRAEPLILVVAPTRELCIQIFDEARKLCYRSMMRPCIAYGGGPVRDQIEEMRKGCDILIATPGRLRHFMTEPDLLVLNRLRFTIIDEADEMLHDDWQEDIEQIMSGGDANSDDQHQYLLFSATFDKSMRKVAKKYLKTDHVRIRIGRAGSAHGNIKQSIIWVDQDKKRDCLFDLLVSTPPARTLVFVKSKKSADFVDDFLYNQGLPSTSIHSDRTQREREDALRAFKAGTAPILIATGVSGRGLDIRNVMHVINFDLPSIEYDGQEEYIHRIGRTARIGNEGVATSFYNDGDEAMAPFLTKNLMETENAVPDFLEQYKPEAGQPLDWNDDSGVEENDELNNDSNGSGADGDAWGNGAPAVANSNTVEEDNSWNNDNANGKAW